ncbi:MAG: phosphatidylinositol-3-phosphatase [Thermoleophilaceae bacterium]|nr:phosphatidylinositol-3-phosphatase [Thermoleophilaceae bacterium]
MRRIRQGAVVLVLALACAIPAPASALPPIKHVAIVVLENKSVADWFGPTGRIFAPYLSTTLPKQGEVMLRMYGIGHNSADNYIAMVSGQPPTPASKNDCPDPVKQVSPATTPSGIAQSDGCQYPANFKTIADQLAAGGLTWKGYNQDIPAPCSPLSHNPAPGTSYARKHNPFVFFDSLIQSGECQANDVGFTELDADLAAGTLPNFSVIVPNECDDGHTACPSTLPANPVTDDFDQLKQADAFLKKYVPKILAVPAMKQDGLLIVTFDESVIDSTACCNEQPGPAAPYPGSYFGEPFGRGGGDNGGILISRFISPGSSHLLGLHLNINPYNLYSVLRSVEDIFGVGHLGFAGQTGLKPFGADVFDRG